MSKFQPPKKELEELPFNPKKEKVKRMYFNVSDRQIAKDIKDAIDADPNYNYEEVKNQQSITTKQLAYIVERRGLPRGYKLWEVKIDLFNQDH